MKKTVATVLAAALLVLLPASPASAHQQCHAPASAVRSGDTMNFNGTMRCDLIHDTVTITTLGYRRTPGAEWNLVASGSDTDENTTTNVLILHVPFNCNKDYKTVTAGAASPGSHSAGQTSNISFHTC